MWLVDKKDLVANCVGKSPNAGDLPPEMDPEGPGPPGKSTRPQPPLSASRNPRLLKIPPPPSYSLFLWFHEAPRTRSRHGAMSQHSKWPSSNSNKPRTSFPPANPHPPHAHIKITAYQTGTTPILSLPNTTSVIAFRTRRI